MVFFQTAESCNPFEKWSFADVTNADPPGIPAQRSRSARRSGPAVHVGGSTLSILGVSRNNIPARRPPVPKDGTPARSRVLFTWLSFTCAYLLRKPVQRTSARQGFPLQQQNILYFSPQPTTVCSLSLKMAEPDGSNQVQNNVPTTTAELSGQTRMTCASCGLGGVFFWVPSVIEKGKVAAKDVAQFHSKRSREHL